MKHIPFCYRWQCVISLLMNRTHIFRLLTLMTLQQMRADPLSKKRQRKSESKDALDVQSALLGETLEASIILKTSKFVVTSSP